MSTARIAPVGDRDEEQQKLLAKSLAGPDGQALNVFTTLAHVPELMRRVNALGGYFMVHGEIPLRERELVILRTAARARSDYELGQHRWIAATQARLSQPEIEAAIDTDSEFAWPSDDQALLEFTDELLLTDTVSDRIWGRVGESLSDHQRIELLVLVGFYRLLAGFLNGVGVELDPAVAEVVAG